MREGRRTFLGVVAGGLGSLIGLVGTARGSGFRRRLFGNQSGCQPSYQPVECFPLATTHVPYASTPPVVYSFPPPGTATIKGGGGFFVWGYIDYSQLKTGTDITVNLTGNSNPYTFRRLTDPTCPAPTPSLPMGGLTVFAYRFDKVDTGVPLQLKTSFTDTFGATWNMSANFTCVA
jgi:hypothetical protein